MSLQAVHERRLATGGCISVPVLRQTPVRAVSTGSVGRLVVLRRTLLAASFTVDDRLTADVPRRTEAGRTSDPRSRDALPHCFLKETRYAVSPWSWCSMTTSTS